MKCDITEKFWYISGRSSVVFAQHKHYSQSYTTRKHNLPDYQPARTTERFDFSCPAGTCTLPWRWVILPMRGSLQVINSHYNKLTALWAVFCSWPSENLKYTMSKLLFSLKQLLTTKSWFLYGSQVCKCLGSHICIRNVLLPATWQNTNKIIILDARFQLAFSFTAVDFIIHLKICRDWQLSDMGVPC